MTGAPIVPFWPAYLQDYRRVFIGSSRRGGSVASIVEEPGHRVEGIVVQLTRSQLEIIHGSEGFSWMRPVSSNAYNFERLPPSKIWTRDLWGDWKQQNGAVVYAYIRYHGTNKDSTGFWFPDRVYLNMVWKTLHESTLMVDDVIQIDTIQNGRVTPIARVSLLT